MLSALSVVLLSQLLKETVRTFAGCNKIQNSAAERIFLIFMIAASLLTVCQTLPSISTLGSKSREMSEEHESYRCQRKSQSALLQKRTAVCMRSAVHGLPVKQGVLNSYSRRHVLMGLHLEASLDPVTQVTV